MLSQLEKLEIRLLLEWKYNPASREWEFPFDLCASAESEAGTDAINTLIDQILDTEDAVRG